MNSTTHIKNCLMHRVMYGGMEIKSHKEQWSTIENLFENTINFGESNSALLIGSRGCGKTWLVDEILKELSSDKNVQENFLIVKLNGLVHTNDRISLIGITQQLQLENVVNDKVFGTFAENLIFLLDCLKSGNKKMSRPIIFILDEFDLFCAHKNQILLYNLFDITQSAQAPICVLGLTCRLDVIELFEKRVKSRFSHRTIYMNFVNNTKSVSDNDFSNYLNLTESLLTLPSERNCDEIEKQFIKKIVKSKKDSWNKSIAKVLKDNTVQDLLEYLYEYDINQRKLRNYLTLLLSTLSKSNETLKEENFRKTSEYFFKDDKSFILQGLSILEICLIIAMKKEAEDLDGEPFNYKMIIRRYHQFCKNMSDMKSVGEPVVMKAFEHLKNLELIIPVNKHSAKENRKYQMYHFAMKPLEVMEALKDYVGLPTEIEQWTTNIELY